MLKEYIKKQIKKTGTYRVLEIEKNKLEDQVWKLKAYNENLSIQVQNIEHLNNRLKSNNEKLKTNNEKLKNNNEKLKTNNEKLKNNNEKLKTNVNRIKRENNNLELLTNNLKAETRSIKQIYLEKNVSYPQDYGKLTVIIPYRKTDDPQREENIAITLDYLSKSGIRNLIISEHSDESSKQLLMDAYDNLFDFFKVIFSYADGKLFNKAHAINQGVIKSKTPYIAIFDVDSLTRKKNIDLAIYLLDKGFDVVHPFNRIVKDVMDKKSFKEGYDFDTVESPAQHRDWADGGIVFWNKRSFIDIGMKNEYFTGWGNEDNEILHRANLFQLKQIRIDDSLYHLYHDRPMVKTKNNIEIMEKMMHMKSNDELQKEINQWPWLKEQKKTIHE